MTRAGIPNPPGAAARTRACSTSASAPKRAVLTLTQSGSSTVFAATDGSRDSVAPSMAFGIEIVGTHAGEHGREAFLPAGQARVERRRGEDREVRLRSIVEEVAGGDQSAERMCVEDDRPALGAGTEIGQARLQVVVVLRPAFDVAAATARAAHPAVVVCRDLEAGAGQLVADVLVAPGVFAETVDQEDRAPRWTGPRAAGLGLVGRPVPDEQVRAVDGADVADDRGHGRSVRERARATMPGPVIVRRGATAELP